MTLNELAQLTADREFAEIIGHLADLRVTSEFILMVYGGWED